ncbi:Ku protein [Streptomyces kunmingensis]|uniref:Non-homologous end joining protein Ku n=1 Tax=Streptomyces kunmingensis TaxID=68225 RepID=A0ABU6C9F7_9ACTN|nr:Ku protein [Streptomyces kunmingensis]MEB3960797.1 Ku protein [Streptomyces kunmingensis]
MPRPVWTGAVSFGLVTIPIRVMSATEDHSIRFHQYHLDDMGRVRSRKVCELEDREVTQDEIGKGYEIAPGQVVAVSDEELREIPLPTAKAIEIVAFVPYESIDPIQIGEGYYLESGGQAATKPYVLLRKALERNAKAAVAKFAWHGRERLGLLRVKEDVIALHALKWPDEIRSPAELAPAEVDITGEEVDEALLLIDSMTREEPLEEAEWAADRYTAALEEVIHAKADGKKPPAAEPQEAPSGRVLDLMAALEQSVQQAKKSRGAENEGHATVHEMPKKKAAAKKTTKKTPAKTATATKSAAKKTAKKTAKRTPRSA